jgi:protein involved in polysaccharide export with SLBB domain
VPALAAPSPKPSGSNLTNLPSNSAVFSSDIRLNPGDKVTYGVAEDPNLGLEPMERMVDSQFNLHFPVSRNFSEEIVIHAENKSLTQIQHELKQQLEATYYKTATVTLLLGVQAVQPGKITITGPVRAYFVNLLPGQRLMLLETILQAGPSEFANLKKVKIMRIDPKTGKTESRIVNVDAIKKEPTKDEPVHDGDRIDIPEKNFFFQ